MGGGGYRRSYIDRSANYALSKPSDKFFFIADTSGIIAAAAIFLVNLNAAVDSKKIHLTAVTLDTPIAT